VENLAATGKAVLYTTHYMEEAQRLCRRTAIIDHGRLLAMGTLAELTERSGAKRELIIETDGLDEQSVRGFGAALGELPRSIADGCARFSVADANLTVLDAARAAEQLGLRVRSVRFVEPNLESVFLELTGRALRD
jgi:ABC-2 type transport system ATP-binding protein